MSDEKVNQEGEKTAPDGQTQEELKGDEISQTTKETPAKQTETKTEETQEKPQGRAQARIQQLVAERNKFRDEAEALKKSTQPTFASESKELEKKLAFLEKEIQELKGRDSKREADELFEEQIENFVSLKEKNGIHISEKELDILSSFAPISNDGVVDLDGAYKTLQEIYTEKSSGEKPKPTGIMTTAPSSSSLKPPEEKPTKMSHEELKEWAVKKLEGKI